MIRTRVFRRLIGAASAALLVLTAAAPAFAHPPQWAPAHGWRAKQAGHYHQHHHYHKQDRKRQTRHSAPHYTSRGGQLDGASFGCNSDLIGAVIGGGAGAILGSNIGKGDGRTAAIIAGAVIGVLAGQSIGSGLDAADRRCVSRTLEKVPDGRTVAWSGPRRAGASTPDHSTLTPTRTWQTTGGRYCREYRTTGTIGGRVEEAYGTACRNPDGSWQIVS